MTNAAPVKSTIIKEGGMTLVKTASGLYVPIDRNKPGSLPGRDPFSVLRPWMDHPISRIGKRTTPFNLPVSTMLEMWSDELISLLAAYLGTLLVNAEYDIVCSDPTRQSFIKAMYGEVHRDLMLKIAPSLFFGFQALLKRFDFRVPLQPEDMSQPAWTGGADPMVLADVEQFNPKHAQPKFVDGRFEGIELIGINNDVDVYYALWVTIGQWRGFGDYLGWGRSRTTYIPWWRKYFADDQLALAIHRGVDPVTVVRHPSGNHPDSGTPFRKYAREIGDDARAGSTITMPSDLWLNTGAGAEQKNTNQAQWDIDYLVNKADITPFLELIKREDDRIAMGMLVPPQAVLEAKSYGLGGPNTAEVLGKMATDILMQDAIDVDRHINDYVFPQVIGANFGPDGPRVYKRTTGLRADARAGLMKLFELLVQRPETNAAIFDLRKIGENLDVPLVPADQVPPLPTPTIIQQPLGTQQNGLSGVQAMNVGEVVAQAVETALRASEARLAAMFGATPEQFAGLFPQELPPGHRRIQRQGVTVEYDENDPMAPGGLYDVLTSLHEAMEGENYDPFDDALTPPDDELDQTYTRIQERLAAIPDDPEQFAANVTGARKRKIQTAVDGVLDDLQEELARLVRAYRNGQAPSDVVRRMGSALRNAALDIWQLGKLERGDEQKLTADERETINAWIKDQQKYLRGVYKEMRQALDKPAEGMTVEASVGKLADKLASWRMPLYTLSTEGLFEAARARFPITKWPKSGDTQCICNCGCYLDWSEDADGYMVQWKLTPGKEHCADCVALANGGPYREGEL